MTYPILSSAILGLSSLIVRDERIWEGFVIIAAVPPGVAVIPFTFFLKGNASFSLIGTMGAYLGALLLTPLIALLFLGTNFINPVKVFIIMLELILLPLVLGRVLVRIGVSRRIEPLKGTLTNWSFFIVTYTIVGMNREVFLGQPLSLLPAAVVSVATTFLLGWMIETAGRFFRADPGTLTSLVLLGTIKNFGLAGGLALALFGRETAVPATVSTVFMIVYIIWLGIKSKGRTS
jgi:BASS family bile acid:Na+ symporter